MIVVQEAWHHLGCQGRGQDIPTYYLFWLAAAIDSLSQYFLIACLFFAVILLYFALKRFNTKADQCCRLGFNNIYIDSTSTRHLTATCFWSWSLLFLLFIYMCMPHLHGMTPVVLYIAVRS